MSVIIRLQNLPWSANAMDIRNFFRGLSIPEGGVHIVGGEQGDAFIAFSTDEDARQAMMNDGGKIKEVQVKLLLSSRSEMHKVIETARQSVSIMQLAQPTIPVQAPILPPSITGLLNQNMKIPTSLTPSFPMIQPEFIINTPTEIINDSDNKRNRDAKPYERKSARSRSKSRDRDSKGRGRDKKDKRDRSRSPRDRSRERDRRRRDRSRSRDRRDRKRDRKDRSRDRERSKERVGDPRIQRKDDKKIDLTADDNISNKIQPQPYISRPVTQKLKDNLSGDFTPNTRVDFSNKLTTPLPQVAIPPFNRNNQPISNILPTQVKLPMVNSVPNIRTNSDGTTHVRQTRFSDNPNIEQIHRLQELDERRNPNAFQITDSIPFASRNVEPRPSFQDMKYNPNNIRMPMSNFNDKNAAIPPNDARNRYSPNTIAQGQCIKVNNLLTSTGYGDIRRFFSGNFISNQGLKIINNDNGKRSGTAYVKFFKMDGKQNALRKNGELLKGKPVYITHLEDDEFDSAVDSYRPNRDSDESGDEGDSQKSLVIVEHNESDDRLDIFKVLLLEDLPGFAKEHDIMKMFSDYSLLSIIIVVTKDVRKQYVAYVQFVNADDAKAALNNKSKHLIGHKVIKVSPCSESAFEIAKSNQNVMTELDDQDMEPNNDMQEDFQHENDSPPIISRDPRQRRFDNRQDDVGFNKFAGAQNQSMMNPRFTNWRNNNPNSMNSGNHFNDRDSNMGRRPMMLDDYNGPPFIDAKLDCTFLKGLPLRTTDRDILDFFSDVGVIPSKIHLMLTIQGQPSGDCFCEFLEPNEAVRAATKNRSLLGNNIITVELVTKQVVDEARGFPTDKGFGGRGGFRGGRGFPMRGGLRRMRGGPGPFNNGGRGGGGNRFMPPSDSMYGKNDNGCAENFGVPGCVLALENVPFRAGIDEILEFFSDFNLVQANVIRRFNEKGHPTGDVRVCLRTPIEAQRALQQLNNRSIRDRKIMISIYG